MNPDATKVLVVDDDADIASITVGLLEQAGYATATACDGVEALQTIQTFLPHLVLLDRKMPGMDGMEVCRRIKADPASNHIFVVLLSHAHTRSEEQVDGLDAGADGYIARPIANPELIARVAAFVRILRLNESLRHSKAFMDGIIENIPLSMWISDEHGTMIRMNQACRDLLRVHDAEVVGKYNVFKDNIIESQGFMPKVKNVFKKGITARFVTTYNTAVVKGLELSETTHVCLEVSISPILDAQGKVTNAIIQHIDITERIRAEEALRESDFILSDTQQKTGLGTWTYDPATRQSKWSKEMFNIMGHEFHSGPVGYAEQAKTIHVEDIPYFDHAMQEAVKFGKPYMLEMRICSPGKHPRTIVIFCNPQLGAAGKVVKLRGSVQDVTERKQTQDALLASEMRFRDLLETSLDAAYKRNLLTDTYDYLSPVCLRISGYTREEMMAASNKQMMALTHPDDRAEIDRVLDQSMSDTTGNAYQLEYRFKHKNGQYLWLLDRFTIIRGKENRPLARIGSVSDITERKRAEDALRENQRLLRDIIDSSSSVICLSDLEGRYLLVNKKFGRLFGIPSDLIVGKTREVFLSKELADQHRNNDLEVIRTQKAIVVEEHNEEADGLHFYSSQKFPLLNAAGEVYAVCGISEDITTRKQAEEEKQKLEALNRQLQKSESLGRMAGAVAHHFNNQLQAVIMNLDLVVNDLSQNADSREKLTSAIEAAQKAADVSALMLTYVGQASCKQEPLDLAETCQQCLALLRAIMPKGVVLEAALPSFGPVINASANQIQQMLTNMLTNAWESIEKERGLIRLSVKVVAAAEIPAQRRFPIGVTLGSPAYACLEVADEGCGIADSDIEKIFDPFYSTKFTGRGMGLPVVLGMVRSHQGAITVESQPGRGSIFRVYLPLSARTAPQMPAPVSPVPKAAEEGTVLLVEDEEPVRKAVALVLKRMGFTVLIARDGVEAVEIFQQHQAEIRCVLCDLTMPRMNGWETLSALRKLAPGIPVILASGYSEAHVMQGDHPELPQVFLSKPYERRSLGKAIARAMGT